MRRPVSLLQLARALKENMPRDRLVHCAAQKRIKVRCKELGAAYDIALTIEQTTYSEVFEIDPTTKISKCITISVIVAIATIPPAIRQPNSSCAFGAIALSDLGAPRYLRVVNSGMKRTALDIKTEGAIFPPSAVRYINNNGPKGRKPSRSKYIKKAARL